MRRTGLRAAAAISLMAPLGAPAQDKSAQDVVVTARKPLDAKEARHLVNQISAATQEQIAKFDAAVCPMVIGFEPGIERQIVARIRKVAKAIGAEVAKERCAGNVVLVATEDGGAFVQALRTSHPELLEGMEPFQIKKLIEGGGPVRAWSATSLVNEDGQRLSAPTSGNPQDPPTLTVRTASFLNPSSKRIIDAATVVIDSSAVEGRTLTQLADYTVMRALAKTRPVESGTTPADTILALFDPKAAATPLSLTEIDVAYLSALYAMPGNRRISYQISRIAKELKQGAGTAGRR
jgi:hypothetical protein